MSSADRVSTRVLRDKIVSGSAGSDEYFIPSAFIFRMLALRETDLKRDTVTIRVDALRALISEFAKLQIFDDAFYADYYKDIKGAQLAGQVQSLRSHFVDVGYIEGRLPRNLAFDAEWYFDHYSDLTSSFSRSDIEGLKNHFLTVGYLEGRAGTKDTLPQSEVWQSRLRD